MGKKRDLEPIIWGDVAGCFYLSWSLLSNSIYLLCCCPSVVHLRKTRNGAYLNFCFRAETKLWFEMPNFAIKIFYIWRLFLPGWTNLYNLPLEISKNRSKKRVNLSRTLSRFLERSPPGEKRETGGKTLAKAVPVAATLPLRKAFRTNL